MMEGKEEKDIVSCASLLFVGKEVDGREGRLLLCANLLTFPVRPFVFVGQQFTVIGTLIVTLDLCTLGCVYKLGCVDSHLLTSGVYAQVGCTNGWEEKGRE